MLKPDKLRAVITAANPDLQSNPDKLQIFLEAGTIVCHGAKSLSFEYRYTLNIIVQDFAHHANQIVLPMLAFLRTQQPELFENPQLANNLIRFEAEILNEHSIDLSLQVDLTERVIAKHDHNQITLTHVAEPSHPDLPENERTIEVIDRKTDERKATFKIPAWRPFLSR